MRQNGKVFPNVAIHSYILSSLIRQPHYTKIFLQTSTTSITHYTKPTEFLCNKKPFKYRHFYSNYTLHKNSCSRSGEFLCSHTATLKDSPLKETAPEP